MASQFSVLDPKAIAQAKALLVRPARRQRMWPVLGAAALLAISAISFATAMIMAPPLLSEHVGPERDAK